jgi:hypothetical protein
MNQALDHNPALLDLLHLLEEWKAITAAEHQAILIDDWPELEALQARKTLFQDLISKAEENVFTDQLRPETKLQIKAQLRAFAEQLLSLEAKNREILAEKLAVVDNALKEMDKKTRSLRHVHKAYGAADRSFWQAYS